MTAGAGYLTPEQLVDRWSGSVTKSTLANWRAQGRGPAFVKLGGKVVYRVTDVDAFENQNTIRRDMPIVEGEE